MSPLRRLRIGWVSCPDAVVVTFVSAIMGLFAFIYPPQAVVGELVQAVRIMWAVSFLLGGVLRMAGIIWTRTKVEAIGCILLFGAGTIYGGTILAVVGARGLVAALAFIGIALATLTRWLEILRLGRKVDQKTKEAD